MIIINHHRTAQPNTTCRNKEGGVPDGFQIIFIPNVIGKTSFFRQVEEAGDVRGVGRAHDRWW